MSTRKEKAKQMKQMGWSFIGLALAFSSSVFLQPIPFFRGHEVDVYALSCLFIILGIYCLVIETKDSRELKK